MDLSIIIVSFNTRELLTHCLDSIEKSRDTLKKEIIVVDNASSDRSAALATIKNKENVGFAIANNQGARLAKGKYILLLNSDTVVKPNTLQQFFETAKKHEALIASCRLLNTDGSIQPQGGYLPRFSNLLAWALFIDDIPLINQLINPYQQRQQAFFAKDQQLEWLSGTALLIDREWYLKNDGLDEHIFMYAEDIDLCYRAAKQGIKPWYFNQPEIVHLGQGSGNSKNAILGELRGLKYIFKKHKSGLDVYILRVILKLAALLRIFVFGMILGDETKKTIYREAFSLA